MNPPASLLRDVHERLRERELVPAHEETPPAVARRVGGGCIHPAVELRTRSGLSLFLKWSEDPGPAGFPTEARGLGALRSTGTVPVPEVLGASAGGTHGGGWLLLEWIESGRPTPATGRELGTGLARLHLPLEGARAGWEEDGYIGSLPQDNREDGDWPRFWAEARIGAQWRRARETGRIGASEEPALEACLARMPEILRGWEDDGLSLLHGDLWSGNVLVGVDGAAHLIDPAVYRGHREVDLAMMELFGGFDEATFAAYRAAAPVGPGYAGIRRAAYQLYPLLVHVNLFGGGYVDRAIRSLRSIVAALG